MLEGYFAYEVIASTRSPRSLQIKYIRCGFGVATALQLDLSRLAMLLCASGNTGLSLMARWYRARALDAFWRGDCEQKISEVWGYIIRWLT
jgi:hypothetical protein